MRLEYKPDNENTNTEELADQLKETLKGDNIKEEMKMFMQYIYNIIS